MTDSLSRKLNSLCDAQPFVTTFVFENLLREEDKSNGTIERNADRITESGSTRKIEIMMLVLHYVYLQKLDLSYQIAVTRQDQSQARPNSGILSSFQPGVRLTIHDLLICMITLSDNTAVYILGNLVGGISAFNKYSKQIGMSRTQHWFVAPPINDTLGCKTRHTVTCARDMAHLLRLILRGSRDTKAASVLGVNSDLCELALQIMCNQKFNAALPFFLDPRRRLHVAHKTGYAVGILTIARCICLQMWGSFLMRKSLLFFLLAMFTDQVPGRDQWLTWKKYR